MIIKPNWRILTIGDGDLSFSLSLNKHHCPLQLTATIFDSIDELSSKYGLTHFDELTLSGSKVITGVDIMQPKSWKGMPKHAFDLVIFQFPLIPGFKSKEEFAKRCDGISTNTLNRLLLRTFLENSFAHFLDPKGEQLAFITSKDVKPYREWNIEQSLINNLDLFYLGSMPFDITLFPDYKIRNVDRDKHVKDTSGLTYVWSKKPEHVLRPQLDRPRYLKDDCCGMCRIGPFENAMDWEAHKASKKHLLMMDYEKQWLNLLSTESTS